MASKSNVVMAETPLNSPQFEFDNVSLNFVVVGRDLSSGEPVSFSFNDSANLNFANEVELNKTLSEKPFLMPVIPLLVKKAVDEYDPESQQVKKLKDDIAALLGL